MSKLLASAVAAAALMSTAAPAAAQEVIAGVFAHDVTFIGEAVGLGAAGKEDGVDVQIGWRSEPIEAFSLGDPRFFAQLTLNSEGLSDFGAVGLVWRKHFGDDKRWYVAPGIGLAYTDGWDEFPSFSEPGLSPAELNRRIALRSERIEFGSKVLFQPELSIGRYVGENAAIELSYVHLSHGQILGSGKNEGMDDVGVRLIWRY